MNNTAIDSKHKLSESRLELLLFSLGNGSLFGINVFKVREVLSCPHLNHLPKSHHCVRGVAHVREDTITVIDLDQAIGDPPVDTLEDRFVVIAELCNKTIGFLVSTVSKIVNLNWDQVHQPPEGSGDDNYIIAVTEIDEQLVGILDVEKILVEIMPELLPPPDEAHHLEACEDKMVLIVDDSAIARKHIGKCMTQMGLKSKAFNNGLELHNHLLEVKAQGKKVSEEYALLVCDIEMPEMDGYTLLELIRADDQLKDLVVLMHTSLSGKSNETMVEAAGADDFMSKFSAEELSNKVEKLLGAHATSGDKD